MNRRKRTQPTRLSQTKLSVHQDPSEIWIFFFTVYTQVVKIQVPSPYSFHINGLRDQGQIAREGTDVEHRGLLKSSSSFSCLIPNYCNSVSV